MIKDTKSEETDGKQIIEVLLGYDTKVWCPMMAMNLYSISNYGIPYKIEAVRVRNLEEESAE